MKLSRLNTALLVAIVLINGYIIVLPIVPALGFWWQHHFTSQVNQLEQAVHLPASPGISNADENRLVIPSMLFNKQVFDGPDMRTLRQGIWRRPNTSTPDKGGNTVIVGHRFTYTNPRGDFYTLDKVKVGDDLALFWQHKKYVYRVSEVKVVPPTAVDVEANTPDPELTLYTCTPLWLPKDRLVVVAKLESTQ